MADPLSLLGLLLGLTGPVEQLIRVVNTLRNNHRAFTDNPKETEFLTDEFRGLQNILTSLPTDYHSTIPPFESENLKNEVKRISSAISKVQENLENISRLDNNVCDEYVRATQIKNALADMASSIRQERKAVLRVSSNLAIHEHIASASFFKRDIFTPCCNAQRNPESITIDLNSRTDGVPDTSESRLKAAILQPETSSCVGAAAIGQAGLGKTCALCEIAYDPEIVSRFTGGRYLMSLSEDATVSTLSEQLCHVIEISGGLRTAAILRKQTRLETVLSRAHIWFKRHSCLFIFDGVCGSNDIDSSTIAKLSMLTATSGPEDPSSRILYATRDETLVSMGESIIFRPKSGTQAVSMLMKAAGADVSEFQDPVCKESILRILDKCAGLPLTINISGSSIQYMRNRWEGDKKEVWEEYLRQNEDLLNMSSRIHPSLASSLSASLKTLDRSIAAQARSSDTLSYCEMHRALCILKKQDWVPISFLQLRWNLADWSMAEKVARDMVRVGAANIEYRPGLGPGLRLHDLTHDFAMDEAERNNEVASWHRKLLDNFRRIVDSDKQDPCWPVRILGNKYFSQNICRSLLCAGREKEACLLLSNGQWVLNVLQDGLVLQFQEDVLASIRTLKSNPIEFEQCHAEDMVMGLKLISKAVRLSLPYCESKGTAAFQLCGRLSGNTEKVVRKLLTEIRNGAPKPLLMPMKKCLTGVDGAILENIYVPQNVQIAKLTQEGLFTCSGFRTESFSLSKQSPGQGTLQKIIQFGSQVKSEKSGNICSKTAAKLPLLISHCCLIGQCVVRPDQNTYISCADISNDGAFFVAGHTDGTITIWNIGKKEQIRSFRAHRRTVTCLSVSQSGNYLISGSEDKTVGIWEILTEGQARGNLRGHKGIVRRVGMSANEKRVVSVSDDHVLRVWDVETRCKVGDVLSRDILQNSSASTISPDGERLILGSIYGELTVWDVENGVQVGETLSGHERPIRCLATSFDGTKVFSGSEDQTLRIWDVKNGSQIGEALTGHESWVQSLSVSSDENQIVSTAEYNVRVWDVSGEQPVGEPRTDHLSRVKCLAMSADGRRVVSGSADHTLRVWDVDTGIQVGEPLRDHVSDVNGVAMSANGNWVAAYAYDDSVRVWNVDNRSCVFVGIRRNWTDICQQYLGKDFVHGTDEHVEDQRQEHKGLKVTGHSIYYKWHGQNLRLAQFESQMSCWKVGQGKDVIAVGFASGEVAILKFISDGFLVPSFIDDPKYAKVQ